MNCITFVGYFPTMTQPRHYIAVLLISFSFSFRMVRAQNLDSLLNNKRVYQTVNIGNLPLPKIDGLLDDEIWELGEWHGDFTQQQPYGGAKGSENTYIKVLYDRSNMFVAIICHDSEPESIRDIFDRRDALNGDMAGIAIDSYFDKRTAFEFNLSAAGQKMDLKHLGDYLWEYNLGSTIYLVWAHDRSGWEGLYNPVSDITGDLFGIKGNNVLMFKLNFWFSI